MNIDSNSYVRFFFKPTSFIVLGIFISGLLTSCDTAYYYQAAAGHLRILNKKQNIQELLENPETSPELVHKLKLSQHVRSFATEKLALPQSKAYTEYADIGRSYVTSIVTAAEPLKLEAVRWWYPFIGHAEYRGYFADADADAYAQELRNLNKDVEISRVRAYSTLGWLNQPFLPDYFKDPVLNTFLDRSDTSIISTLIHEMAHQVLYVPKDTAFNESFASFVEQTGTKKYLQQHYPNHDDLYQRYLLQKQDRQRFKMLLTQTFEELQVLYNSSLSESEKLAEKAKVFQRLKENFHNEASQFKVLNYQHWFQKDLNNAHILGVRRYNDYILAFSHIFDESQQDWKSFYQSVKEIAALPEEERTQILQEKMNQ